MMLGVCHHDDHDHDHDGCRYLNAAAFNLSGVLEAASNELDWPACSWGTGFRNTTDCPISYGVPMGSLYQRMRAANLCNHRDFQNLGVNGARTGSMAPLPTGIVNSLARNQRADAPLLTFHSLIGNDVCNGHPGLGSMTTPEGEAATPRHATPRHNPVNGNCN